MARGRLGGTKAKIRGKVGSEIYQLKRDPNGALVQSVYAQNPNPTYSNTEAQAKNRCIMGQIERMWHALPQIIKDSYANVPQGALSFQRFSKLNYAQLKADFEEHFDGNSEFSWVRKRWLDPPAGPWILTDGTLSPVTWDNAEFSLGENNSFILYWNKSFPNATYGDFLSNFSVQVGDRLILAFYRRDYPSGDESVETWTFRPRTDYSLDTPWREVDRIHVFDTDCPYQQLSAWKAADKAFMWGIDTESYPKEIKIACFALFIARDTDNGTLFSSSRFTWAQRPVEFGWLRQPPRTVFNTWLRN